MSQLPAGGNYVRKQAYFQEKEKEKVELGKYLASFQDTSGRLDMDVFLGHKYSFLVQERARVAAAQAQVLGAKACTEQLKLALASKMLDLPA